jgi:hypothetical protein
MTDAFLKFAPDDFIVAFWFLGNGARDWLAVIFRRADTLHLRYRFRYYEDEEAFNSKDRKSCYAAEAPLAQEPRLIATVDFIVSQLQAQGFTEGPAPLCDRLMVMGNQEKFLSQAAGRPWCHLRKAGAVQ